MKTLPIKNTGLTVPVIGIGCMRMGTISNNEAHRVVKTALELGLNFFDHADLYAQGRSEEIFRAAMDMGDVRREDVILQSKCGIRKGMYDFSKEHIIQSAEGSLKRLGTDYLDILLLHRPDALTDPEEVAQAFDVLHASGKVRYFGVSNHNSMQIALLQKHLSHKLVANQLQLSITNAGMIRSGLNVNMENDGGLNRDDSVLDYCRLHDITIQPWSPLQYGFFEGVFVGSDKYPKLNEVLSRVGAQYSITPTAVAIAWLLRHPARMQPIIGSMNPGRIGEIARASEVTITRQEWYDIYRSAGNELP